MPRKRTKTPRRTPRAVPEETPDETPYDPEMVDDGVTLFDSTAEDSYVRVKRLDEETKKWEFQFRLAPHEATEEHIQSLRGGGSYRCIEMVPNPNGGGFVFGRQRSLMIAGPPKPLATLPGREQDSRNGGDRRPMGAPKDEGESIGRFSDIMGAGLLDFFRQSREMNNAQMVVLKDLIESRRPDVQPMAWLTPEMVTALVGLFQLFKRESVDPLTQLEQITNMLRSNTNPTATFKDMLETVNDVFDVRERVNPPKADDPISSLLGENASKIIDIIATATQRKGSIPTMQEVQAIAAQHGGPPQQGQQQLPSGGQSVPDDAPEWQKMLAQFEPRLLSLIEQDKDASVMAMTALQFLSPKGRAILREFLSHGNEALQAVLTTFPRLAQHQVWVTEFFSTLYDDFFGSEEEDGGSDDSDTDNGDDAGPSPDA